MPRREGNRNRNYAGQRRALALALRERLVQPPRPGLRELAVAAGVSVATLRHYFGDREGLVEAVLEEHGAEGAPYIAAMSAPVEGFAASIHSAVDFLLAGIESPAFLELHALGLLEGLNRRAGPAYLGHILEPALASIEARLVSHLARGEVKDMEPRFAALDLLSPLLVAALHQHGLGGRHVRPLDLRQYAEHVSKNFVQRYSQRPQTKARNSESP